MLCNYCSSIHILKYTPAVVRAAPGQTLGDVAERALPSIATRARSRRVVACACAPRRTHGNVTKRTLPSGLAGAVSRSTVTRAAQASRLRGVSKHDARHERDRLRRSTTAQPSHRSTGTNSGRRTCRETPGSQQSRRVWYTGSLYSPPHTCTCLVAVSA